MNADQEPYLKKIRSDPCKSVAFYAVTPTPLRSSRSSVTEGQMAWWM
jgi:hypothetical protein